jgi:hypothetical protein
VDEQARLERLARNTFGCVADRFIADKLSRERKGDEVADDIRRELLPLWRDRPAASITSGDARRVVKSIVDRGAPAQARNVLGTIKRLFSWAMELGDEDEGGFGLEASPAAGLKPSVLIGDKVTGDRILSDLELAAFWRAARRLPYPYGSAYRLLGLTALRLNEVADAAEEEFEPNKWIIPRERMKARESKARPHAVPITPDVGALLAELPPRRAGKFLFSTTGGSKPVWISDKIKKKLDARMLRSLKAFARMQGKDPDAVTLPKWKNHDLRRTVRSGMSRLRIPEEVREAVLAHVRPGIKKTYDLYDYFDEKADALEKWAGLLHSIVDPPASNVVPLRSEPDSDWKLIKCV